MYHNRQGVQQNYQTATKWFTLVAKKRGRRCSISLDADELQWTGCPAGLCYRSHVGKYCINEWQ
jgi:hypothetical protein